MREEKSLLVLRKDDEKADYGCTCGNLTAMPAVLSEKIALTLKESHSYTSCKKCASSFAVYAAHAIKKARRTRVIGLTTGM